jgi:hypothetical protein
MTLSGAPTAPLWETGVTPPGIDGGPAIDVATMRQTKWRPFMPSALQTMTEFTVTAMYDPSAYTSISAQVNVNQSMTVALPNGGVVTFWGFIRRWIPNELREGQPPTAQVTVNPSNQDNTGAEVAPTYTPPP